MTYSLRPYQEESLAAIRDGHGKHESILVELPTGTGKTVIFCRYASSWEHGRTMIIAPQITLIGQAAQKICKETGIYPSIEQAENRSNENEVFRNPYVVASKQSLCGKSKRYLRFRDIGLVIVDEAHYACTEIYHEMLSHFRSRGARVLGVTATPKRHDKRAMGQIFDDCVYRYGIKEAVSDGWLVPIRVNVMQLEHMDLNNVGTGKGFNGETDFVQSQLNAVLETPKMVYEIAEAAARTTRGMKTAVYCSSVKQACQVAVALKDQYGINAEWICSDESKCTAHHRGEVMRKFMSESDEVTHLCNVGILTTGWDFPDLRAIVNARPTKSLSLYTQIMGRITRPCESGGRPVVDGLESPEERRDAVAASMKPHGLVIDLVDASLQHKLMTVADVLGGEWTLEERQAVLEEAAERDGPVNLEEILAKKRKDEEERIRRAVARKKVREAKFNEMYVDPYSGPRSSGRPAEDPLAPATSNQMGFLRWKLGNEVYGYAITKREASKMITMLKANVPVHVVFRRDRLRRKGALPPKTTTTAEVDFNEVFSVLGRD